VAATYWRNEKLMAKNLVVSHDSIRNYQDALKQIKDSLNVLSIKHKFLNGYYKNNIDYFKAKNVASSFKNTYNKKLEELKIQ
jgi:hypothetical protein